VSSPTSVLGRYRRLLSTYLGPSRGKIAALSLVLFGNIGIQVATPIIASRFIDEAVGDGTMRRLVALAVLPIALAIIAQGLGVAETWFAERVSWDATNALRIDLLAHLLRLDAGFHLERTQGELIERVDGDVANLARFFSQFVINVLGNLVLMLGILVLVIRLDWLIGVGLVAFVAVALVAMLRIRATSTHQWAAERQGSADFYGLLGEYLGGLEDIRANGAGAWVIRRSAEAMRQWLDVIRRAQMRGYALVATSNLAFGFATAFAFGLAAIRYRDDAMTLGGVYLVVMYTAMLRRPTEQLRNEVQDFQVAGASLGRVEDLLATTPRIVDGPGTELPAGPLAIEFENVTFGYGDGEAVLHEIDLRIKPGRVLGILGRTGSGKTSMIRLVPRFHDPMYGSVRLGGVDVREVSLDAVRSRVGLVTQDVTLFGANVRDNLALFDDTVPDGEILAAIDAVGLSTWFDALPDGLATRLGPGGAGLSAGQAQLLACARILLDDPDIVILDEASSRLDPVSERLLHRALGRMLANRTGIIVAHRLSTFAYADDILVLADGRVQEVGARVDLAANPDSHYSRLVLLGVEEVTA
jgi:ATP-binding cassette subfamily B protein